MCRRTLSFPVFIVLSILTQLFFCGEDPEDPAIDPDNAKIEFINEDGFLIKKGSRVTFRLALSYFQHFSRISVSGCGIIDTSFTVDAAAPLLYDTIALTVRFMYEGQCTLLVEGRMKNLRLREYVVKQPVFVLPEDAGIRFVTAPETLYMHTGRIDTLLYTTALSGNLHLLPEYTVATSSQIKNDSLVTLRYAAKKDSVWLRCASAAPDSFNVTVTATAHDGEITVTNATTTNVQIFASFTPKSSDLPRSVTTVENTTVHFIVPVTGRPDQLTVTVVDKDPVDDPAVAIVKKEADSLELSLLPDGRDTLNFGIVVANQYLSDTFWYAIPNASGVAVDSIPPAIMLVAGFENGSRIVEPNGSLLFSISDSSGIVDVHWKLNGSVAKKLPTDGESYGIDYDFTSFGTNRITLVAYDNSIAKNVDSIELLLYYNTKPEPAATITPVNGADSIPLLPTFTWKAGSDADGDTMQYTVFYGRNADALSRQTWVIKTTTLSLNPSEPLAAGTKYYWKVVAFSSGWYSDTVESEIASFTTASAPAAITTQPVPVTATVGEPFKLSVTATGIPMPTSFKWYKNGKAIPNAILEEYSVTRATVADSGSYYVSVGNGVGTAVSTTVLVAVLENISRGAAEGAEE